VEGIGKEEGKAVIKQRATNFKGQLYGREVGA
jgi:hypothetical protein